MLKAGRLFAASAAAAVMLHVVAPSASAQPPNVVIQWNQMIQTLFGGTGPGIHLRALPMMHIAMFDAINSIEGVYTPYLGEAKGSHGASAEAAAAVAARDVLAAIYPAQVAAINNLLTTQLAGLPRGLVQQGQAIGQEVAAAILQWRQDDGWPATILPDPSYVLPAFPGLWQPTPPASSFATFTFYPQVRPFAMVTSTQFLPPPPPTLTSARYATDFNEVKSMGAVNSLLRTPDQTLMTQVHAGVNTQVGFFHVWNRIAADIAQRFGLSLIDTARTFALLSVALHDGLQTSITSKFVYGLWRPVTAIRRASEDLNPATAQEDGWTPLLTTPTYPSYAGNAACLSAASARALQIAFGRDDIPFTVTYPRTGGLPTEVRNYEGFADLAQQQADSRVLGGIHYRFDNEASQAACPKVPDYTAQHFMRPRNE